MRLVRLLRSLGVLFAAVLLPLLYTDEATAVTDIEPVYDIGVDALGAYNEEFINIGYDAESDYGAGRGALQFDLTGTSGQLTQAVIKIYMYNHSSLDDVILNLYGSEDDAWDETSGGLPSYSESDLLHAKDDFDVSHVDSYIEFDVTEFVQSQLSSAGGNDRATFILSGATFAESYNIYFHAFSREGDFPPLLTLTMNNPPVDIAISDNEVAENAAVDTVVGTLTAVDPDAGDTFTFAIMPGGDGASFAIAGNQLVTKAVFDYETKNSYSVTVRVTDSGGLTHDETFTISVKDVNEAPTSLTLSNLSVYEDEPENTVVGTLSATDPDAGDTFTYEIVPGVDGASFAVDGDELVTNAVFDYETKNSYSVTVRVTDSGGLTHDETFTIEVIRVNLPPTALALSNASVHENEAADTVVGLLSATDPDTGDTFTYEIVSGGDGASFAIDGDKLVTKAVFDYETKNSYSVTVRVTDSGGLTHDETFTISITDVNDAPTAVSLSHASVSENEAVNTVIGTLNADDQDAGETFTYEIVPGGDGASFAVDGDELVTNAVFDYETKNSYSVTVRVTDSGGLMHDETFTISVTDVNEAPTALSLSNASVSENEAADTVVGLLSATDPDTGDTFTYEIVPGGDGASFAVDGDQLITNEVFDYERKNSYIVAVRVTDSGGLMHDETFTISVTDVNDAPTAVSLSHASVNENDAVNTVIGTLNADDQDAGETFTYEIVPGGDSASFAVDGDELVTNAVFDYETKNSYSVTVRATDSGGLTVDETFAISVTDVNEAPTALSLSNASVSENEAADTVVGLLSATDPDTGDTFTYEIVSGGDGASFAIDGDKLVTKAVFDYETRNSYSVTVRVTDSGGLTVDETFTISVTDVNDAPTALSLSNASVSENEAADTVIGTFVADDQDAGETFTYEIVPGGDSASFAVDGDELVTNEVFDYETRNSYSVTVRVTDSGGLTVDETFAISVTDVNDAPTALSLSDASVSENEAADTVVGLLSATDPDAGDTFTYEIVPGGDGASFAVDGDALVTKAVFDYETKNSYSVTVRVTDSGGLMHVETFTISVTDVNEAPTALSLSNASVSENEAADTVVGLLSATDPDTGDTFTYEIVSGGDGASFAVDGDKLVTKAVFDYETKNSYSVTVRVTDSGGLTVDETFAISVTDVNDAPAAVSLSHAVVNENEAANTVVGILDTEDQDAGETFTYEIVPDGDGASFAIDGDKLVTNAVFDYESKNSYSVTVRATDSGGLTVDETFAISVTDVNEAPTALSLSNTSVNENEALNTVIGLLSATDPDAGDSFTYEIVPGGDGASFAVDGDQLITNEVFDYERKNSYIVAVRVTDSGGLVYEETFTISVTDVEELSPITYVPDTGPVTLIDGVGYTGLMRMTISYSNGQSTITVKVDESKLLGILKNMEYVSTITIAAEDEADIIDVQLPASILSILIDRQLTIEIQSASASYALPLSAVNLDELLGQSGQNELLNLTLHIMIKQVAEEAARIVEDQARLQDMIVVVTPIEFTVVAKTGDRSIELTSFLSFVKRMIMLPDNISSDGKMTGVLIHSDGTFHHVPTRFIIVDGKTFAEMHSMTNSVYAVIRYERSYTDIVGHWARTVIENMSSRLIVRGVDEDSFMPDRSITRAEFAAVMTNGLGLRAEYQEGTFRDVNGADWYADAAAAGESYGLISGYDRNFMPDKTLTRQEAMVMIARVLALLGWDTNLSRDEVNEILQPYGDHERIAGWAREAAALCVRYGIFQGNGGRLMPQDDMSRAEAAAVISRLLEQAGMI